MDDVLEHLGFGLIGFSLVAVAFGAVGRTDAADPLPAVVPAPDAPVAAVYDVALDTAAWTPAPAPPAEDAAPVEPEPPAPAPAAPAPVAAAPVPVDRDERPPAVAKAPTTTGATPSEPARRRSGPARRCDEPPDPGIVAEGDGRYRVAEAVIERYTRDWSRLRDLGWSEVHRGPDGRPDGMRIGGIRCGSDPWDAGFRSGDVIHAVNGRRVHGIPQVLAAYAALRGARVFEVDLTRRGERRTVRFRVIQSSSPGSRGTDAPA